MLAALTGIVIGALDNRFGWVKDPYRAPALVRRVEQIFRKAK